MVATQKDRNNWKKHCNQGFNRLDLQMQMMTLPPDQTMPTLHTVNTPLMRSTGNITQTRSHLGGSADHGGSKKATVSTYGTADVGVSISHAPAKTSDVHIGLKSPGDTCVVVNQEQSRLLQPAEKLQGATGLVHRQHQVNEFEGDLVEVTIDETDCMPTTSTEVFQLGFINALEHLTPDMVNAELQTLESQEIDVDSERKIFDNITKFKSHKGSPDTLIELLHDMQNINQKSWNFVEFKPADIEAWGGNTSDLENSLPPLNPQLQVHMNKPIILY